MALINKIADAANQRQLTFIKSPDLGHPEGHLVKTLKLSVPSLKKSKQIVFLTHLISPL